MARSTLLGLTALDDRIVPATLYDLTTVGAEETVNDSIVRQVDAQPTGTGFIHSFVRLQGASSGGGSEQGYNTTARPLQFDENSSPQFTRALLLRDIPVVTEGGAAYREFLLDINQRSLSPKLSLDEVRIYVASTSGLVGYDAATKTLAGLSAVYDLDSGGDVAIILNARLNSGSGSGDMMLRIPDAAFTGADPKNFVYLYSKMGLQTGATANGGFEEWAVRSTPTPSGPGTSSIGGRVFLDVEQNGMFDSVDFGLQDVIITLQGVNDLGQTVVLTTTTDGSGFYEFIDLRAGVYTLFETQPFGTIDGADFVGSLGGSLGGNDYIVNINLGDGVAGVGYDFSEFFGGEG